MNKQERIEKEINKTLDLLETADKIPHNPLFFSKLQERMQEQPQANLLIATLRPVLLTCLLVLNFVTILSYINTPESTEQAISEQGPISTFASDFDFDQNNVFIIE